MLNRLFHERHMAFDIQRSLDLPRAFADN